MAPGSSTGPQKIFSVGLLALIAAFAIFVAIYGVPTLSALAGIDRQHATYGIAAVAFVAAIVFGRWSRKLKSKKRAE